MGVMEIKSINIDGAGNVLVKWRETEKHAWTIHGLDLSKNTRDIIFSVIEMEVRADIADIEKMAKASEGGGRGMKDELACYACARRIMNGFATRHLFKVHKSCSTCNDTGRVENTPENGAQLRDAIGLGPEEDGEG